MAKKKPTFEHGDILAPLADPWTAQSQIFVYRVGHLLRFGGWPNKKAPKASEVFLKPRRDTVAREHFVRIENLVGQTLDGATNGKVPIERLRAKLAKETEFTTDFIDGCLRILVAQQALVATEKGRKKKVELRLSANARVSERRRAYAASFAHELVAQSEQIGRLIKHGGTVGTYREALLRELIQRHIPQRFHAATGFIDGCANQVDILIYDQLEYAPLFRTGDLVVVPAAAVRAIIEVKSDLTRDLLEDALGHLEEIKPLRISGPPVFTGVFAYDGATVPTLTDTISKFYRLPEINATLDDLNLYHQINDIGDTINAVCILQQSVIIITFDMIQLSGGPSRTPMIVELESLAQRNFQAAIFFDYLSRFLRQPFNGERLDVGMGPILAPDVTRGFSQPINSGELWGPYTIDDESIDNFENQLKAYYQWLDGEAWIEKQASEGAP